MAPCRLFVYLARSAPIGVVLRRGPTGQTPAGLHIAAPRSILYVDGTSEWTDRTVHFNRLLRDGWTILENEPYATLWQRRHPQDASTLRMTHVFDDFTNVGGPYVVEYSVTTDAGLSHDVGRATWADWDHQGRLVVARKGQLGVWNQVDGFQLIEDFNGQQPDPQPAPSKAL